MKKIFTSIFVFAALFAVSCTERTEVQEDGFALTFEAFSTDLQTKADAGKKDGVDDPYKENTIATMDWFFFSDAEGTKLVYHTRTDGNTLKVDPLEGSLAPLQKTSYLYAVANYADAELIGAKTTLEELKALPVSTEFTKIATDDEGNSALKLDKGNFNFIMDTYNKETKEYLFQLTPSTFNDTRKIEVPLTRLAVKIAVKTKIAKSLETVDSFGNKETWTPVLSQTDFDVYMVDALKAGFLSGEPVSRADQSADFQSKNYFTYGRNLATVVDKGEEGEFYVWENEDPFYTYPQTWKADENGEPFLKIILPWMSSVKGSAEFHYKIVIPAPKEGTFTLERNNWYQVTATVKVLGGTENDYVLVDDVLVSVANWADPGWLSGSGLNSAVFFDVPTKEFHVYSMDSFDIPIKTNSSANAYITKIEFKDYSKSPTNDLTYSTASRISANSSSVASTVFTLDDGNTAFSGIEHDYSVAADVSDKYNKKIVFTHSMTDIYVQRDIYITIVKDDDATKTADVIIHQHPAIELKKQGAGDVFVNGYFGRVENAKFGSTVLRATTYDTESSNSTTQSYDRTRDWEWSNGSMYHCWSGFGTVVTRSSTTYRPDATYTIGSGWSTTRYYTRYYAQSTTGNWYYWAFNSYDTRGFNFEVDTDYGDILTTTVTLDETISTDFYTTDIAVTAFSDSNNSYATDAGTVYYKIGDPRVKASEGYYNNANVKATWSLVNYLSNETGNSADTPGATTTQWSNAGNILICSQEANDRALIAPHILISSALNANGGLTWEQAVKRGATYQEAGYPAGRWRLPTEAEVAFIIARQNDGTIPTLYATNSTYWTGSGRTVQTTAGTQTITFANRSETETHSCRFVYDLWYWGDETMSTNQYHPNMHIEN